MLLKDALELFLAVDRAESTRLTYARFLRPFVLAIGPERPIDLICPEDIAAFVNQMRDRSEKYANHPLRPKVKEKLSPVTIYKNVKMIKTFFRWCVKQGYLAESPAAFLINRRPVRRLGQGRAATDEELESLLAASRFKVRDRAIILLLANSGCRAGEAASLRIRDLDLDDLSALVVGKGGIQRRILFNQETADALQEWLIVRPKTNHDYVFVSTRGHGPLKSESLSEVVSRLSKKAGLKRVLGSHSLRHRVGMTLGRRRVAPRVTQHYLGHTNITTTLEYYQDVEESDLRAAGRMLELGDDASSENGKKPKKRRKTKSRRWRVKVVRRRKLGSQFGTK
jgi:integrase/recombinase XerC